MRVLVLCSKLSHSSVHCIVKSLFINIEQFTKLVNWWHNSFTSNHKPWVYGSSCTSKVLGIHLLRRSFVLLLLLLFLWGPWCTSKWHDDWIMRWKCSITIQLINRSCTSPWFTLKAGLKIKPANTYIRIILQEFCFMGKWLTTTYNRLLRLCEKNLCSLTLEKSVEFYLTRSSE